MTLPATSAPATPVTRHTLDTVEGAQSLQQLARIFAGSSVVPKQFQRSEPNCIIALDIAGRLGLSPMAVFQNLYIIQDKPAWSAPFIISLFNHVASDRFEPLEFRFFGTPGTPERTCVAFARRKNNGSIVEGPMVSRKTATDAKWGPLWSSMPELMLRYRAAAFFVRTTCPEILFGLYTREEALDIVAAEKTKTTPQTAACSGEPAPSPVQKLLQSFAAWSISRPALEEFLGHSMDTVSAEEMQRLREIWREIKRTKGTIILDIFPSLAGGPADIQDAEPVQVVEEKKETVSTPEAAPAQAQEQPKAPVEQRKPEPAQQPAPSPAPKLSKEELRAKHIEHFNIMCRSHKVPPRVMVALFRELVPRVKTIEDAMAEMGSDDRNFQDILRQVKAGRQVNAPQQAQAVNA